MKACILSFFLIFPLFVLAEQKKKDPFYRNFTQCHPFPMGSVAEPLYLTFEMQGKIKEGAELTAREVPENKKKYPGKVRATKVWELEEKEEKLNKKGKDVLKIHITSYAVKVEFEKKDFEAYTGKPLPETVPTTEGKIHNFVICEHVTFSSL